MNMPAPAAEYLQRTRCQCSCKAIEPGPLRGKRPQRQAKGHRPGRKSFRIFPRAPMPHDRRQRDFHRADLCTATAERRSIGMMMRFRYAHQRWIQCGADWAGIGSSIRMSANCTVDRTMIEAGAAADAAEHILRFCADQPRASVVEQHDVEVLRPIGLTRSPWPAHDGDIARYVLPRCRACQEAK